jgi:hypothetical protein
MYPALEPIGEEKIEGLDELYDDEGDLREERAFRMWMVHTFVSFTFGVSPALVSAECS